jgi:hypothetical protein
MVKSLMAEEFEHFLEAQEPAYEQVVSELVVNYFSKSFICFFPSRTLFEDGQPHGAKEPVLRTRAKVIW